jgi:hypothetical protein
MGDADRRGEAGFGLQATAAGDELQVVRAAAQLVDEVGDQIVEPAGFADDANRVSRGTGIGTPQLSNVCWLLARA